MRGSCELGAGPGAPVSLLLESEHVRLPSSMAHPIDVEEKGAEGGVLPEMYSVHQGKAT